MKASISIIALVLLSFNAQAALHKWVDAEGKVHYSDTIPPEVSTTQNVRNISGKDRGDAPADNAPKSLAEREAEFKKSRQAKEDKAEKKAQTEAQAEARSRNCEASRQNARMIEEGVRITTYDAKGERTFLDDETRAKKLEEARESIRNNCD
jgi:hypothetical protein